MTEQNPMMGLEVEMAAPLHLQRLERSLDVRPLLGQINRLFENQISEEEQPVESSDDSDSEMNKLYMRKEEKKLNKLRLFNLDNIGEERQWLQDILLSDESDSISASSDSDASITEEDFENMLKFHMLKKKYQVRFYQKPENVQYQYYSTGLLSNHDKFLEHQKHVVGTKRKKDKKTDKKLKKEKNLEYSESQEFKEHEYQSDKHNTKSLKESGVNNAEMQVSKHQTRGRKGKKHNNKNPEVMAIRRRKIWMMMSKKELGKVQRAKINNHKEMLVSCKRVAQHCMKYWRQKAMQSQKNMKETIWRAKRLTREMQSYWKKYDRVERETRKRLEKEAEEQRKMDIELIEAKRQQRKLNFLITQTELYAHFMSRKLGKASTDEQLRILNQLDEEKNPRLAEIDDYDSDLMKQKAKKNAMEAFDHDRVHTQQFDSSSNNLRLNDTPKNSEHPQPSIFEGNLKGYQLKGMNWLANLYDQGISGILADEMGLGKTVQSIAFLCHIAEKYSVWGPFLIISPASTLHNWQQEMARFVPSFKVVPYWGNPQDRKILRQFWDTKDLHTQDASFHVVITSYQLVITDYKCFNRIKWQYMILDEAQAIKSTSSMRWKLLLGFSCRNRLLLSGTPIQNSMAELWALLHFIMPTLFDSHDEFNEWFSKDIESHAENKTGIDEKHLSRLHMILKPFMLRRIKKDVENELSDKIEVMVYCPLTTRQKILYSALKKKIRVEDLLHYTGDTACNDKNFTSNLMNLVMQFRKVCNHPELFERRDAKTPFFMQTKPFQMPILIYNDGILDISFPSKRHLLYNKFFIFSPENIHRELNCSSEYNNCGFSFTKFIDLSAMELSRIYLDGILFRLYHSNIHTKRKSLKEYWEDWDIANKFKLSFLLVLSGMLHLTSLLKREIIFTINILNGDPIYTHTDHIIHSMPETIAHSILRNGKGNNQGLKSMKPLITPVKLETTDNMKMPISIHPHTPRPPVVRECQQTSIPRFLCERNLKVSTSQRMLHVCNASAVHTWKRYEQCGGKIGRRILYFGCELGENYFESSNYFAMPNKFSFLASGGLTACKPQNGWSNIVIPDKQTLVTDAGKLTVLDNLLKRLKEQGHRVLIYSQMTKMIDLLEEYMYYRKHTFMRLDGSSKISDRRDMVADFQKRTDIFVFLLSTRAGGLGINLTAADTVIFYDSDWNPTVDQQAMDRAHRLGQTKQVTVYRLICKGTIEERILQRAREKSEIQRMVISGGNFKPDTLKPKEVVSLLLDDEELKAKYIQRSEIRKQHAEEVRMQKANLIESNQSNKERKRKQPLLPMVKNDAKRQCTEVIDVEEEAAASQNHTASEPQSTADGESLSSPLKSEDDTSNEALVVDVDGPASVPLVSGFNSNSRSIISSLPRIPKLGQHHAHLNELRMRAAAGARGASKRGRPRGSKRGGSVGGKGRGMPLQNSLPHGKPPTVAPGNQNSQNPAPSGTSSSADSAALIGDQESPGNASLADSATTTSTTTDGPTGSAGSMLVPLTRSPVVTPPGARRGPGRPRLKPNGPSNQGYRYHHQYQHHHHNLHHHHGGGAHHHAHHQNSHHHHHHHHHHGTKIARSFPTVPNRLTHPGQLPHKASGVGAQGAKGATSHQSNDNGGNRPFGFYVPQNNSDAPPAPASSVLSAQDFDRV